MECPKEMCKDNEVTELFVPGRVCLLGEHTDWAVLHRGKQWPEGDVMEDGMCLVYGTNCGLYARMGISTSPSSGPEPPALSPSSALETRGDSPSLLLLHFRSVVEHPPQVVAFSPLGSDGVGCGMQYETMHNGSLLATLDVPLLIHYKKGAEQHDDECSTVGVSPVLERIATGGTFFSYIAGAALEVLLRYPKEAHHAALSKQYGGHPVTFWIDNYQTDLPVGKGLSSSAAACVLVVRALTKGLLGLSLDPAEEMELAYRGERRTPSRCGRMDQCVAHGVAPVSMIFRGRAEGAQDDEGGVVQCERIALPDNSVFYFVVADMNRGKDTHKILSALNRCFEGQSVGDANDGEHSAAAASARTFLAVTSARFVREAWDALRAGSPEMLGRVFTEYQAAFDAALCPVCPGELTAPRLHELLFSNTIAPHIYGGKGVGSQGDGAIQFVCRGPEAQAALANLLDNEEGCHAFKFELRGASVDHVR